MTDLLRVCRKCGRNEDPPGLESCPACGLADPWFRPGVDAQRGGKFSSGKDRWDLLPLDAVRWIVKVLAFGARRYAPGNWRNVENGRDEYYAALMRHLEAWERGELIDPDSKLPHMAHVGCNALFLLALGHCEPRRGDKERPP